MSIYKNIRISDHISYREATKSITALRRGIDNTPDQAQLVNMRRVAVDCFEPVRNHHGKPIGVSSFFRIILLNVAVGGSDTSSHCSNNDQAAIDLDADKYNNGITNREIGVYLFENQEEIDYDQLIFEYPDKSCEPRWIHVSKRKYGNRRETLIAYKENGKTKYRPY